MGPYCRFCGERCFVKPREWWPKEMIEAYSPLTLAATCHEGQKFEKKHLGYCFDDAVAEAKRLGTYPKGLR